MPASLPCTPLIGARGAVLPDFELAPHALNTPETFRPYDFVALVVYSAGSENLPHAWVSGKAKAFAYKLLQTNNNELLHHSRLWQTRLKGH